MDSPEVVFSVPGKVFLLGEYACLDGGTALLDVIEPGFSLQAQPMAENKRHLPDGVHPASPAGVLFLQHAASLKGWSVEWKDPTLAKFGQTIGVGSSSAQFVCTVRLLDHIEKRNEKTLAEMLSLYWAVTSPSAGKGLRPSGADVALQFAGSPIAVKTSPDIQSTGIAMDAIRGDVIRVLFFTGTKVRTHEQLEILRAKGFPGKYSEMNKSLNDITLSGIQALEDKNVVKFSDALRNYQKVLSDNGIGSRAFTDLIHKIEALDGVLACKGAGLQNGDCLVALIEKKKFTQIEKSVVNLLQCRNC